MDDRCPCGRSLPLMKMLEGRKDDLLTALNGRIISPSVFPGTDTMFGNMTGLRQYRVIQERRDKLTIQLLGPMGPLDRQTEQNATREIEKVFGEGMLVEFQLVDRLEREPSGKLRKVISLVPVEWS